jgi:hypothetical protein
MPLPCVRLHGVAVWSGKRHRTHLRLLRFGRLSQRLRIKHFAPGKFHLSDSACGVLRARHLGLGAVGTWSHWAAVTGVGEVGNVLQAASSASHRTVGPFSCAHAMPRNKHWRYGCLFFPHAFSYAAGGNGGIFRYREHLERMPPGLAWNRLDMGLNRVSRLRRQTRSEAACRAVLSRPFTTATPASIR